MNDSTTNPEPQNNPVPQQVAPLSGPVDYTTPVFSWDQLKMLGAKLNPEHISERQSLSYIEAHQAIRHANMIFGYGNWQRNEPVFTLVLDTVDETTGKAKYSCAYLCTVSVTVYGLVNGQRGVIATTYGTGFGDGQNMPDKGKAHEFATKEAESDAMKRALIAFGDQFGLALYDKQKRYVGADDNAPDTYGERSKEVSGDDIRDHLNTLIGTKKAVAVSKVKEFTAANGVAGVDDLTPELRKELFKKIK